MNQGKGIIALIGLAVAAFIAINSAFIVPQTASALVFNFGRFSREKPITTPGLYWKLPFFESVVFIDNRVLDNDLPPQEVLASDQKNLVVDAFTRYRITEPLKFYQTLNNVRSGNLTLERIVNARVRSVLAGASTTQIVRA
jgi:modulator of FtsH protease HflC